MAMTYTVIGPVVKRVTRNINKPPKDPKPQKGDVSAFENAIKALNPLAHYRFREPNFNARVKDSTSNNYHLTKQLAAATRSAVKTRTTHPGGAYFPPVTFDNWATTGTFYKGTTGLLNGAENCTILLSVRIIQGAVANENKLFGIGTENIQATGSNDLITVNEFVTAANDGLETRKRHSGGASSISTLPSTGVVEDGVSRLYIARLDTDTIWRMTSSKPGHELLIEETAVNANGPLDALNLALIMNARGSSTSGSSTTTGMIIDQAAIWDSDIGATAETNLHSLWSDEVAGAGYYPSMMQFDGSTGYYSKTGLTVSGNKVTAVLSFSGSTSTGGASKILSAIRGSTSGRQRMQISAVDSDNATAAIRNCLRMTVVNSAGTVICNLITNTGYLDGNQHTIFASFDGDAGTATFIIDGISGDQNATTKVSPTTGTLETGTGDATVGAWIAATQFWGGKIGFFGHREAYLTNWSDFMDGNLPKAIDEKNWTEWGAQPLFWSHTGQLSNNKGSAGDATANGTITMTTGGSP
jgi:hypothetical protein